MLKDVRSGNTNTRGTKKMDDEHDAPQEGASGGVGMLHDDVE